MINQENIEEFPNKYQKSKIYKIYRISNPSDLYIGSTTGSIKKRFTYIKYYSRLGVNRKIHNAIRIYGNDNFKCELIENYPCNSKKELKQREQYYKDLLNANLNNNISSTGIEYDNMDRKEYNKQYKLKYKDKISEYNKEYYKKKNEGKVKKKTGIKPKKFDEEIINKCIKLYKEGISKVEIAKELNMTAYYVTKIIKSH